MVCNEHNTPGIIKYPFWQMTAKNTKAVYACVNRGEAYCPREIVNQAVCIDADIEAVLALVSTMEIPMILNFPSHV